jgi:hypothetical protein
MPKEPPMPLYPRREELTRALMEGFTELEISVFSNRYCQFELGSKHSIQTKMKETTKTGLQFDVTNFNEN